MTKMTPRELVNAFLMKPYHTRMLILYDLGLISDPADFELKQEKGEMELYKIAFRRARERGLLDTLRTVLGEFGEKEK